VIERLAALAEDPRPRESTKLKGVDGLFRVRQGDHRIVYAVFDQHLVVLALSVGDRRDVYEQLAGLQKTAERFLEELDRFR
jgi:mRNA interferase RelE/StbE